MKMRISKKWVHKHVVWWFEENSITNINDWEKDILLEIAKDYVCNELMYYEYDKEKLFSLIKNDPLYVKNYKQWWLKNSLNKMKTDF